MEKNNEYQLMLGIWNNWNTQLFFFFAVLGIELFRQALYHLSHSPNPFAFSLFFRWDFMLTLPRLALNCYLPISVF
jgi:hypothetical protein